MDTFRETLAKHTKIVGLKWNKLEENKAKGNPDSPVTRSMARRNALSENVCREPEKQTGMLKRAQSVRDAFGTLRQKLRVSTRRKKRLVNIDSPLATLSRTPASVRKSSRKSMPHDVKMYSPFTIDTPGTRTTPRAIRMGVHHPKRFNFSSNSPGHVQLDVNALAEGIQALSSNCSELNKAIDGMTPMRDITAASRAKSPGVTPVRRTSPRRPIFV